jgi:hypothetical protein
MEKTIEFLEQKVQWIAIGLGGLFCLYMIWAYVVHPPASVQVGSETLTPGEIDPYTVDHMAEPLDAATRNRGKIKVEVPEYVAVFKQKMGWEKAAPIEIAENWQTLSQEIPMPAAPNTPGQNPVTGPGGVQNPPVPVGKVAALPVLPPAAPSDTKFGRSVVLLPQPTQPGQPVQQVQVPQQVAPGQPVPGGTDKDWVTALFKLPLDDLAKAYKQANVPQPLQKVMFLQVVLERQELDSDGKPVPKSLTTIPPLITWRQQTPPPYPGEGAQDRAAQAQYLQWAANNTPDILEPLFYTTIPGKGDQWTKPGQQVLAQNLVFDPSKYTGPLTVPPLTADQRKAVMDYRREQYKLRQQQKHQAQPRPNRNTGPMDQPAEMGDGINFAPARISYAPAAAPAARPAAAALPPGYGRGNGMLPPPDIMEGDMGEMGYGGSTPVAQGLPQPGTDYPSGEYDINDPKWQGKTIEIWANDDTVESGKTYQYRIQYKIKNPVFLQRNIVTKPEMAAQFDIVSAPSEWTSPVQVPPLVNFFVANSKAPGGNTVRFQIFRWDDGQQKSDTFVVGPGDQVGGVKNGVDFSTDWTVVDFREDPRQQGDTQVLLENNKTGQIVARSYRADSGDALYTSLKAQIAQATAAAAAANGQQPGGPIAGGVPYPR